MGETMAKVFLNWRGPQGRETVDEIEQGEMSRKEFRAYIASMQREYAMAGMWVYQSSRPCKEWARA